MADPLVSVFVPTVTGREDYLAKALASYRAYANVEIFVFTDYPGCGKAWAEGFQQATGDYLLPGADDVEFHPGWFPAAKQTVDLGYIPCARILNTDGTLQSCGPWEQEMPNGTILRGNDFTRSPIVSRAQWEQLEPLVLPFLWDAHYYTDNVFTWAGRRLGMETVVCRGFEYTHHLATAGRGAGMSWDERMQKDGQAYQTYIRSFA